MRFIHLHTHSHYSLLDGLAKIDDIIERAKELKMDSIALTDHGNLYGAIEFYKKAKKADLKPILGMETYVAPKSRFNKEAKVDDRYFHLILLAENETGWKNLLKLASLANLEGFYYKPRVDDELLEKHHEGLIALSACLGGQIPQLLMQNKLAEAEELALKYKNIFGEENFYLELQSHPKLEDSDATNVKIIALARKTNIPLVATQDAHYTRKEDAEYQDILLAVQTGNKIDDENRLTMKVEDFSIRSSDDMTNAFKNVPEAIENTGKIADRCNVNLILNKLQLPKFPIPETEESAIAYLRKKIAAKTIAHYADIETNQVAQERISYELSIIEKMGFADYFLIVEDYVNWAKERGIVANARGSAAGSIISYILDITNADPIKYGLLFERFLNPDRISMPDIDVDFTDTRRNEVFAYIRSKYGESRVAQIITFGTMAARAAIRDAGRALGISYGLCDQIAKLIPLNQDLKKSLGNTKELKEIYNTNEEAKKIIDAAIHLEGVARHASVHACGIVIGAEDLTEQLPLQRSPQDPEIIITQFEMHSIEDLGLLKMDMLGLKNLTIIENTVRLIKQIHNIEIDISKIPQNDPKTFELFQHADTIGVFQLESSGMRRYLKELKPTDIEDVIAMIALYRPGPMELIPSYIARKHGKEQVTYLHPKIENALKKTYGIGIYQEQMMQIARDMAGFTPGEADTLRKAIGKKIKELLDQQKEKLLSGMKNNGIDDKTAQAVWELFPPFGRYGFNRSHAACYAIIAEQTAYLKSHYPVEFMTSLLNSDSGDVERIAFLIVEAEKMKTKVLPPDINKSYLDFIPEENNIRFGLLAIKNVGQGIVDAIIEERNRGGEFISFIDVLTRIKHKDLNKKSIEALSKTGVFDSLGVNRGAILANMETVLTFVHNSRKGEEKTTAQVSLFGTSFSSSTKNQTELENILAEDSDAYKLPMKDKLTWEKELLGLYISGHPLDEHKEKIEKAKLRTFKEIINDPTLKNETNTKDERIVGVISKIKKILTKKGQPMLFVTLEDFTGELELIVFNDTLEKTSLIWRDNNTILAKGRLSWRNDEPKFLVSDAIEL